MRLTFAEVLEEGRQRRDGGTYSGEKESGARKMGRAEGSVGRESSRGEVVRDTWEDF